MSANPWLTVFRPDPSAKLRLFCLPHAGGAASLYRRWADALPPDIELNAVQLPGRENRFSEPPFVRWRPLVEALADGLASKLDKPFALFGHSMGAMLGYEL